MAKGTSVKGVNFSIPEGADPLGVGIPDLGRSSYDPIATIRAGWDESRQERLMRKEQQASDYQAYMKAMPTVEGVNQKIAQQHSKDLAKMGGLFKRRQEMGGFKDVYKGEEGQGIDAELSQLETKIATDLPIHKHYSEQYEKDLAVMRSPTGQEKLDMELTSANVDEMNAAEDVEGFAQPFANNAGSLLVYKPEEVDMIGFINDSMGSLLEGENKITEYAGIDMNTGKAKEVITEGMEAGDQKRVYDAMVKAYRLSKGDKYGNRIDQWYMDAPASEKVNADGVKMGAGEWWATQFAPDYGMGRTTKYTTLDKDKPTGVDYGIRDDKGNLMLTEMATTRDIAMPVTTKSTAVKRKKVGGGYKYEDEQVADAPEMAKYNSTSIPMTGIDLGFPLYIDDTFMETETGSTPAGGRTSSNTPVSLDFIPVYTGNQTITFDADEVIDEKGNKSTRSVTLKPGDRIPAELEETIQNSDDYRKFVSHKPFMVSASMYGATIKESDLGGMTWEKYMSRHGKSTLIPWDKVKRSLYAKMVDEGYSVDELEKTIQEMNQRLNSVEGVF